MFVVAISITSMSMSKSRKKRMETCETRQTAESFGACSPDARVVELADTYV
jgi:hypothetical protein